MRENKGSNNNNKSDEQLKPCVFEWSLVLHHISISDDNNTLNI